MIIIILRGIINVGILKTNSVIVIIKIINYRYLLLIKDCYFIFISTHCFLLT
jgi:hypothetical protein